MTAERPRARGPLFLALLGFALLLYFVADPQLFLALATGTFSAKALSSSVFFSFLESYGYFLGLVYIVFVAILLFFENRNPDRTLAWLLVLGLLPVVGGLLYWVVGPNFRYVADKKRLRSSQKRYQTAQSAHSLELKDPLADAAASVIHSCTEDPVLDDCAARILRNGKEAFPIMLERMKNARQSILLESYILRNDTLGTIFKEVMMERARAGVTVCLIYDAVGSWAISAQYLEDLRCAGVLTCAFLPVSFPMFRGANYRNHRKILVVDSEAGFIGGLNIGDEYLEGTSRIELWRDTHMLLEGPAVARLTRVFLNDLMLCANSTVMDQVLQAVHTDPVPGGGGVEMHLVASGPDTPWDTLWEAYFTLVSRTRKKLWITTPYLVPGDTLLRALCASALRGSDVRLLLPARADHWLVHWASLHMVEDLLRAGVRVFLYRKERFIHAKTMTVDGVVYSAGSGNFDTRSLHINFEIQGFFYNKELARQGEMDFENDLRHADELQFATWVARPIWRKFFENVGKLFSSLA